MPEKYYNLPHKAFYYDDPSEQYELIEWMKANRYWEVSAQREGGVRYYVGGGEYSTVYPTGVWLASALDQYPMTDSQFRSRSGSFPNWT